jgi:hypothetical protein
MDQRTFKPYKDSSLEIPISTLDDPVWYFDGDELGLVIEGKSPGYDGEARPIWISIEERNFYCDRGHFLVKILTGCEALCLDEADFRPNYYMHLEVAKSETIEWLKWRIRKERAESYGAIRNQPTRKEEICPRQSKST